MATEEITFLTSLIFWKLYETNLNYTKKELDVIIKAKFSEKLYDGYYFENYEGERMPLKWIATTGSPFFLPICLKCCSDTFKHKDHPEIHGKIQIDAHLFPEGVIVMQAKMDFGNYMKIEQHIKASIPTDILLSDGINMKVKLDQHAEEINSYLHENFTREKTKTGETKASPWHHNWIWWKIKPELPIEEFDIGGKYIKWALGMCTRSDKWSWLNPENYAKNIEAFYNLSPYSGNCVYITHPGNCIIPSPEFTDPNSVKNTLIDVLFAAELGNVQRYLILNHLQDFNFKSLEIQELLYKFREEKYSLKELVQALEELQEDLNERVLEVNYDLQITRTPRLIFTSVFKTKIFRQMIDSLHGFDFLSSLDLIISEIKDSLARERDVVSVKASEEECRASRLIDWAILSIRG
ncbi:MAG: hypothetical protein ACTSQI_17555 [Candidatus Helarchaeota archaeon]